MHFKLRYISIFQIGFDKYILNVHHNAERAHYSVSSVFTALSNDMSFKIRSPTQTLQEHITIYNSD